MNSSGLTQVLAGAPALEEHFLALQSGMVLQGTLASIKCSPIGRAVCFGRTQSQLLGHLHKLSLRALRANMDGDSQAVLRSASGQGAGAFLETPPDDRLVMTDSRFTIACMRRLGCQWPAYVDKPRAPPLCANTTADGRVCGQPLDPLGKHQECCMPTENQDCSWRRINRST